MLITAVRGQGLLAVSQLVRVDFCFFEIFQTSHFCSLSVGMMIPPKEAAAAAAMPSFYVSMLEGVPFARRPNS